MFLGVNFADFALDTLADASPKDMQYLQDNAYKFVFFFYLFYCLFY